ncbi:MAG: helix-turn-helix transcriptional regulator [Clostridia bacterium]|jgi:DNA-binding Xre family transcriptional regulator|nr:helix-turn-helix transcriptional regulator [Clostridia bacterium]
MITYKPFWHYCIDKGITKTYLHEEVGLSWPTISKLREDEYVKLQVLERICLKLKVTLNDIVEIQKGLGD